MNDLKHIFFGICLLLPEYNLFGMDSAMLTSFPPLIAAQSVTRHKEIGRIIAHLMLRKEAQAFITKRLTPALTEVESTSSSQKVIPLCNGMIGIITSDTLEIRSAESTELLQTISIGKIWGHEKLYAKRNKRKDQVVTTTKDYKTKRGTLRIWDIAHGTCTQIINTGGIITCIQFRTSGEQELLIAASKNFVRAWAVDSGLLCASIEIEDSEISLVKTDPRSKKVLLGFKGFISPKIWHLESNHCIRTLEKLFSVYKAKFSPSGDLIVILSSPDDVGVYSVSTGNCLFKGGKIMKTKEIKFTWDAESKSVLISGLNSIRGLYHMSYDNNKQQDDRIAYVLTRNNNEDQSFSKRSLWHNDQDACIATFNKTRDTILSTGRDKIAKVWCASSGKCIRELIGHSDLIDSLCFNDCGDKALTYCSKETKIRVWDVETGLCLYNFFSWPRRSFFSGDVIVAATKGSNVCYTRVRDIDQLFNNLTFEQVFLINAIYEIIILRRLATVRASAQGYHAFLENEDIYFFEKSRITSFPETMKRLRGTLEELFSELKGEPRPIMTEDGKTLQRDDFIFDFTNKPENLLAAYLGLAKPIRSVLNSFVKLPTPDKELEDDSCDQESTSPEEN